MTKVNVYDDDAKLIEKIADINDITTMELIEALLEYSDEVFRDYGWRNVDK